MSASSSGSDCCNNCGHALATPGAKFCVNCGQPQRQTKKCVQCAKEMTNSGNFCVHCGHDQREPPAPPETKPCIKCGNELPSSISFCGACGQNQSQPLQQQQPCLYCATPIAASSPCCPVCFAYTDPDVMRSIPLKQCINRNCQMTLMGFAPSCYKCNTNQATPPQHSSPQSGMNPFLYSPAMFSMPSGYNMMTPQMKYCADCRGTLSESSDTCVHCQARQPMPTPRELLVTLQPFYPGPLSYQAMPQSSTPAIAARFPNQSTTTSLVQSQPTPLFLQHSESTSLTAARFSFPPRPIADPNGMLAQSTPVVDTRQVSTPSPMKGVTHEIPVVVTTSTTTSDSSLSATSTPQLSTAVVDTTVPEATLNHSLSATSTPQLSTTLVDTTVPEATLNRSLSTTSTPPLSTTVVDTTVLEATLEEDVNKSKDDTIGPVDSNSASMEVDTSKGDATPPSLNPSARLKPGDDSPVDQSSIPDISSSTSSVDKDVTHEQGLDIDENSPVGSKRLSDDESSSEHSKRSKTDKDPDHEAIVAPSRCISKRQLSNGVSPTDEVKRSKIGEDLTASGKEDDNEKPGASHNSGANELQKDSSGSTVGADSKTDVNNEVVDPALSSGAVVKEKVTESDSGINISESVGHTPLENNGSDGDNHSEKKDGLNQLKPKDTHNDPLTIPSDAPHDANKQVQRDDNSSTESVPKVTDEHTIEDKKEFENGKATNNLDTNDEPAGKRQGSLIKKASSDDDCDVYKTPAGSPSLSGDENDPNFIAEEESHVSSEDKTSTLVPGIDPEQV